MEFYTYLQILCPQSETISELVHNYLPGPATIRTMAYDLSISLMSAIPLRMHHLSQVQPMLLMGYPC